jgi:hypothetical protein
MAASFVAAKHYTVRPGLVPGQEYGNGLRGLVTALSEARFASISGPAQEVVRVNPDGGEIVIHRFQRGEQV